MRYYIYKQYKVIVNQDGGLQILTLKNVNCSEVDVSIIVPIFNASLYLEKCIDSLLNQNTKLSYEIILVNDGSNDNSDIICNRYAQKNKNIKYIKKDNTGVSDTRNVGIKVANGKYVLFVDSDDYVDTFYVEDLANNAIKSDCDLSCGGYDIVYENSNNIIKNSFNKNGILIDNKKECLLMFGSNGLLNVAVCKCIRKSLLLVNDISFEKEAHSGEDIIFYIEVLKKAKSVYFSNENHYFYMRRDIKSGVNSYKKNQFEITERILKSIKELYELNDLANNINLGNYYLDYISTSIYNLYRNESNISFLKRNSEIKRIMELNDKNYVALTDRKNLLSKIALFFIVGNHYIMSNIVYSFLFFFRNNAKNLYLYIRDHIFLNSEDW